MNTPSLSQITLRAPTPSFLDQALRFYKNLGFSVIRQDKSVCYWLVYLTSPTPPPRPNAGGMSPFKASIPLGLGSGSPQQPSSPLLSAHTVYQHSSIHQNANIGTSMPAIVYLSLADSSVPATIPKNLVTAPISFCFTARDLAPLKQICLSFHFAFDEIVQDDGASYLYVADPLGNVIVFTTKVHPLSEQLLSSDDFNLDTLNHADPANEEETFPGDLISKPLLNNQLEDQQGPDLPTSDPSSSGHGKRIGIMTSGGDSQGMNAAVRSVVRMAHMKGLEPFAVIDGYQGLVDNDLIPFGWADVQGLLRLGGTIIGSARCMAFRERAGRLKGALNLVERGIDALVVIGGDGSLTGADRLRSEWGSLLDELLSDGKITSEQRTRYAFLTIVGLVGSIDNDMSSTDMTIGCASALYRICEAIDAIEATALAHGRAFVVEVMGRHCGWLALMAALATGADWLFVPERPPLIGNWEDAMCDHLSKVKNRGQKKMLVIVSEGAIDRELNPIRADSVRDVLAHRLDLDARVTTLGHVQRGGTPCFFDRYLGTVQGVRAVEEILKSTPDTPSPMIGISQNKITVHPLMKAVELTHAVSKAIDAKQFGTAMELRDPEFMPTFDTFVAMNHLPSGLFRPQPPRESLGSSPLIPASVRDSAVVKDQHKGLRIAILNIGAPAGGVNAATRAMALLALNHGHTPIAIYNGISGLIEGDAVVLSRRTVQNWTARGGSELGTNRAQPDNQVGICAYQLQRLKIHGLMVIGGFEAFTALHTLTKSRDSYPALCIPMVHIPATISNNVPGTDYSLGCDTALNAIVDACDKLKQSASASRKRVFVMEVHGGNVGYLATMGGLAGGATGVYIPEEGINLDRIQNDVHYLNRRYTAEQGTGAKEGRVFLRNENASETYTTETLCSILRAESKGQFDARSAILGHLQQGGSPTPLDRVRAVRLAAMCFEWIEQHAINACESHKPLVIPSKAVGQRVFTQTPDSACVVGIRGAKCVFTPVDELMGLDTDLKYRRARNNWWMHWRPLVSLLAGYSISPERAVASFKAVTTTPAHEHTPGHV